MSPHRPLVVLLPSLVACSTQRRLDEVRAVCEMDPRSPIGSWETLDGSGPEQITGPCAEVLGEVIGLDWDSFHQAPHGVERPDTQLAALLWGVYALVASDTGTVDELTRAMNPSELLVREFGPEAQRAHVRAQDDATALWFAHLTTYVHGVRWLERDDCTMNYDVVPPDEGTVSICGGLTGLDSVVIASALIHEGGHAVGPLHTRDAYGFPVDADGFGAYGLGIRWLDSWVTHNDAETAGYDVESHLGGNCVMNIVDTDGFEPCEPYE